MVVVKVEALDIFSKKDDHFDVNVSREQADKISQIANIPSADTIRYHIRWNEDTFIVHESNVSFYSGTWRYTWYNYNRYTSALAVLTVAILSVGMVTGQGLVALIGIAFFGWFIGAFATPAMVDLSKEDVA